MQTSFCLLVWMKTPQSHSVTYIFHRAAVLSTLTLLHKLIISFSWMECFFLGGWQASKIILHTRTFDVLRKNCVLCTKSNKQKMALISKKKKKPKWNQKKNVQPRRRNEHCEIRNEEKAMKKALNRSITRNCSGAFFGHGCRCLRRLNLISVVVIVAD